MQPLQPLLVLLQLVCEQLNLRLLGQAVREKQPQLEFVLGQALDFALALLPLRKFCFSGFGNGLDLFFQHRAGDFRLEGN